MKHLSSGSMVGRVEPLAFAAIWSLFSLFESTVRIFIKAQDAYYVYLQES